MGTAVTPAIKHPNNATINSIISESRYTNATRSPRYSPDLSRITCATFSAREATLSHVIDPTSFPFASRTRKAWLLAWATPRWRRIVAISVNVDMGFFSSWGSITGKGNSRGSRTGAERGGGSVSRGWGVCGAYNDSEYGDGGSCW